MRTLLRLHEEGALRVEPVDLGPMPEDATQAMKDVAADIALRIALRLADGDDRPLPYACKEAVDAGYVRTVAGASYVLRRLVAAGVIWSPGSLHPRGRPDGTRTFLPGPGPAGDVLPADAGRVEASAAGTVQEAQEVAEDVAVRQAVADDGREVAELDGGRVAASGAARQQSLVGHAHDVMPGGGQYDPWGGFA